MLQPQSTFQTEPGPSSFFDDALLARLELLRLARPGPAEPAERRLGPARTPIGDGLDFADHRPYSPGDDVRFIDWRAAARQDRLLVRRFHTHSIADVALLLDASASMDVAGRFTRHRQLTAALAAIAIAEGRSVRVMTLGAGLAEPWLLGPCREELSQLWAHLAAVEPAGRLDLPACLADLPERLAGAGTCVLISDGLDMPDGPAGLLAALEPTRRDVAWLCPQIDIPANIPAGAVRLVHAESAEARVLTVTPALQARAEKARRDWLDALGREVRAAGACLIPLPGKATILQILFEILPGLGLLVPAP